MDGIRVGRWLAWCAVGCLVVGVFAWVGLSELGGGSGAPYVAEADMAGGSVGAQSPSLNSLVVPGVQSLDDQQQASDAERARHNSSTAFVMRQRSRTEFEHLGAVQAARVAREAFPKVVEQHAGGLATLPTGERVTHYVSTNTAQVVLPDGKHAVVESTQPVAKQTSPDHFVPIDLSLEGAGSDYVPAVSDVAVQAPKQLSAGVRLADVGVSLTPADARGIPLGGSGTPDGSTVFYANTQADADTIVKPMTAGFEIDVLLRSPQSPGRLYFRIEMPSGAHLSQEQGSNVVRVVKEGQTIASILTPYAQDAAGTNVPVTTSLVGNLLSVVVDDTSAQYQYPIEVDPYAHDSMFDTELPRNLTNWHFATSSEAKEISASENGPEKGWTVKVGANHTEHEWGALEYTTQGESYINRTSAENGTASLKNTHIESTLKIISPGSVVEGNTELPLETEGTNTYSTFVCTPEPVCREGGEGKKASSTNNSAEFYYAANKPGGGVGGQTSIGRSSVTIGQEKGPEVSYDTTHEFVDGGRRNVLYGSGSWLGPNSGSALEVNFKDPGVGISHTQSRNLIENAECTGGVQCPAELGEGVVYNSLMVNGEDEAPLKTAEDAIGLSANTSAQHVKYKVDSIAPYNVKLSGLPSNNELGDDVQYVVKAEATDGKKPTPSSGIKSLMLLLDGREVGKPAGSCALGECTATAEWTLSVATYGAGKHTLTLLATDNAGNVTTENTTVTIHHAAPIAMGPGTVTPGTGEFNLTPNDVSIGAPPAQLTVSRSYGSRRPTAGVASVLGSQWNMSLGGQESLEITSNGSAELVNGSGQPVSFVKTGKGVFESPQGDSNLKLEGKEQEAGKGITEYLLKNVGQGTTTKFTQQGGSGVLESGLPAFSSQFGSEGPEGGEFSDPNGIAVDAHGNLWVTDWNYPLYPNNNRVEVFNEKGEYQKTVGRESTGNVPLDGPTGIAVDAKGNAWVSDSYNNRIEEFNEKGEFVRTVGFGVGNGESKFEICTSGCRAGISGSGSGQFNTPVGLAVDPHGNVWVADDSNNRVEVFNEKGEYQKTVGSVGTGSGQFKSPTGVSVDGHGNVWVTDFNNARVDELNEKGEFVETFGYGVSNGEAKFEICTAGCQAGIAGSGSGQLDLPTGIAADSDGGIWVVDTYNNRVEVFNEKGEYLEKFGSLGSGSGQFNFGLGVVGIARDAAGDVWVTDPKNYRVEKWVFSPETAWLPTVSEGPTATSVVTYAYKTATVEGKTIEEPTQELGAKPEGATCSAEPEKSGAAEKEKEVGCRELTFKYAETTTATGENKSEWGEYKGRLVEIKFTAYDPSSKEMRTTAVAKYSYDKQGRLRAEWDPRISPELKTAYGYDAEGHVTALTPPGQESWAFAYGTIAGDPNTGRLLKTTQAPASAHVWKGELPKNVILAPKLSGSAAAGGTMGVSLGAWSGEPVAYEYQWEDCNSAEKECTTIPGATNENYTVSNEDIGHTLVAVVTATNGGGSVSASASTPIRIAEAEYSLPSESDPNGVAQGPDGDVWYTDYNTNKIGKMTTAGEIVAEYKLPAESRPGEIVEGPDKNLWFVDYGTSEIGKITTAGTITEYKLPFNSKPVGITPGPDGNLWYTDYGTYKIGKITTAGAITEYKLPEGGEAPNAITQGSDKNLWYTDLKSTGAGGIGKITTAGAITEYNLPLNTYSRGITSGPDGNLWYTSSRSNTVGKITTSGVATEYTLPGGSSPEGIVQGAGNLWFTDYGTSKIGKITTSGAITEYGLPTGSSPNRIATGPDKNLWFAEYSPSKIGKIDFNPTEGEHFSPQPGWTVEYRVPLSGTGLPTMTKEEVKKWGQEDDPVEGMAIFPPDEPEGSPATDYRRATLFYEDENDRLVNTMSPGQGISTAEYNSTNDVVRSLSPDNRATALKESKPAEAAELLSTDTEYNSEGNEVLKTLGPQHTIKLPNGSEAQGRKVEHLYYNENAPSEGETYRLVTKSTDAALVAGKEEDLRTTEKSYSGQSNLGWKLRKSTSVTADPSGLKLTTTTTYDANTGNVLETKSPEGSSGSSQPPVYSSQFGSFGSGNGQFKAPKGLALDAKGDVLAADEGNSRIEIFNEKGEYLKVVGSLGSGNGQLKEPKGVAVDSKGNIWVADTLNNRVEEFNEKGEYAKIVGSLGSGNGQLKEPKGITVDSHNNIWVADTMNNRIEEFNEKGEFVKVAGSVGSGNGQLKEPRALAVASSGLVWVADSGNSRLEVFKENGTYEKTVGSSGTGNGLFKEPRGITIDSHGNVWVGDTENNRVQEFNEKGEYIAQFGSKGTGSEQFHEPWGIQFDSHGDVYVADASNNRVEKFVPASTFGTAGAHDDKITYYTAKTESPVVACRNHPEWVNLPCQVEPAAQPGVSGLPELPVTTTTYNIWDEGEVTTETVGTTTRTKTTTYDAAGRVKTTAASSTVGTALPTVTITYNSETGALEKQSTTTEGKTKTITSVYNPRGQLEKYTDADEGVTTYEYDSDGRVKKTNDGKGIRVFTYSETTGLPVELTDEYTTTKLTFTATYDAEGNMLTEGYPNGMTANYAYDATGKPVNVEYVKQTHCSEKCPETWFKEAIVRSIHAQTISQTSTFGADSYAYDNAGRLTQVQETPVGKSCSARIYTYDEDTNRRSLTKRECGSEGGESERHTYDSADRLMDTGVEYSTFDNVTKLPAVDAGGNELTSAFYVDNQLASQTQNGETIGYNLDPALRTRETVSTGKTASDIVSHYVGAINQPAWTSNVAGEWTRNIAGINGGLAAVQNNGGTPVLQIANLHGDVIATASSSETVTKLESSSNTTEFGVPTTSLPSKYSWLGSIELPTELPSGVIAMGARSYVPQLGRFLQPDPVPGGSANAYSYTYGNPIDTSDPTGEYVEGAYLNAFNNEESERAIEREIAREAAARAEAERLAAEAAAEAARWDAGAEFEEEYWEEWEEEEGYEYASFRHGAKPESEEAHLSDGVLLQEEGGTQGEGMTSFGSIPLCKDGSEGSCANDARYRHGRQCPRTYGTLRGQPHATGVGTRYQGPSQAHQAEAQYYETLIVSVAEHHVETPVPHPSREYVEPNYSDEADAW